MEQKKIIQIAVAGDETAADRIYALCDDGTLYVRIPGRPPNVWKEIPPINAKTVG